MGKGKSKGKGKAYPPGLGKGKPSSMASKISMFLQVLNSLKGQGKGYSWGSSSQGAKGGQGQGKGGGKVKEKRATSVAKMATCQKIAHPMWSCASAPTVANRVTWRGSAGHHP